LGLEYREWLRERQRGNQFIRDIKQEQKEQTDIPDADKLLQFEQRYGFSSTVILKFLIDREVPPTVSNFDYVTWVGLLNKVIGEIYEQK
jgi:hypothetical protein